MRQLDSNPSLDSRWLFTPSTHQCTIIDFIRDIHWIRKKANDYQKVVICFIDYRKIFGCVEHLKLYNQKKRDSRTYYGPSEKFVCKQVRIEYGKIALGLALGWRNKGVRWRCLLPLYLFIVWGISLRESLRFFLIALTIAI